MTMLQKHYPLAVIGKSYLSLLYGIELLRYFDKILLLDDDRLSFGDLYQNGLTEIDYSFLQTLGNDRNIEELKSGEFLKPSPYFLHLDQMSLFLGRSPSENLKELTRKIYSLFPFDFLFEQEFSQDSDSSAKKVSWNSEDLDKDYRSFCERLGLNGLRFKSIENFTFEYLMGHCPESIQILYRLFAKQVKDNPDLAQAFQYYGRILFHKKLSSSFTELELFHFFLCIIGPHYELDIEGLSDCLSREFSERGGHYKQAQVREWKFHNRNPWSIELSSFEGIIHPQKISFLGAHPTGLPLKIEYRGKTFSSVHFDIQCEDERLLSSEFTALSSSQSTWHFLGALEGVGTDFPFCKFQIVGNSIRGQFLYREKKGSKLDFYKESLLKKLVHHLESKYPGIEHSLDKFSLFKGREVFMDQSDVYSAPDMVKLKQVGLFDFSIPTIHKKLRNVHYYGPLRSGPLGVFGQLMEIKESPKYQ